MLVSAHCRHITHTAHSKCFVEAPKLEDCKLREQALSWITITSTRGQAPRTFAIWRTGSLVKPSLALFGFAVDVCGGVVGGHCDFIPTRVGATRQHTVGAVMGYARQPRHVRKNTQGRDWVRATLRVRTERALRGLSWRFSKLTVLRSWGVEANTGLIGYRATSSAQHWAMVVGGQCGLDSP